jgi:chromosome segregation ATPase
MDLQDLISELSQLNERVSEAQSTVNNIVGLVDEVAADAHYLLEEVEEADTPEELIERVRAIADELQDSLTQIEDLESSLYQTEGDLHDLKEDLQEM